MCYENCYAKVGDSLAVRIPQRLIDEAGLQAGTRLEISLVDGKLILQPSQPLQYSLDELLDQVTDENRHSEIDTGHQ